MLKTLERMLQGHLRDPQITSFVSTCVVPVFGVSDYERPVDTVTAALIDMCRRDPQCCTRLFQALQSQWDTLADSAHAFDEMKKAARELVSEGHNLGDDNRLNMFASKVHELFPSQDAVYAYLRLHAAPYEPMNQLRADLAVRPWNFGAAQDLSMTDGKGFLGKFAAVMLNVCLGRPIDRDPLQLRLI